MEKSITKNSIFYLIYNVLNVAFPFATGIYVARVLFPSDIGLVETARNLAQYFVTFSFLGIPTYGLREIANVRNDKDELSKLYSELMVINTISTAIFLILYLVLIFSVEMYRSNIVVYIITGISIALNFLNNTWLYEGLEKYDYISIRNSAFKLISLILLLIFVKDADDYLSYALISVIGTAGNYIFNIINAKRYVQFQTKGLDLKRHLKSIIYLVVVNLAIEIYSMVDVTMLGLLCESQVVAYYAYGIKIQKILLQVINTFTVVLVPRISWYYKERKINEFNELLTKALQIILIFSLPIIVGINFVGGPIIIKLYGQEYIRSAYVLRWLINVICISPIGYLLGSRVLLVTGRESRMIRAVGIGAFVNIIGNYIMIPKFQENGAAMASVISEIVVATVYIILSHKYFRLNVSELTNTVKKLFISLIIMTIFLLIGKTLNLNSFVFIMMEIPISAIFYFGVLLIIKEPVVYSYFVKISNRLLTKKHMIK